MTKKEEFELDPVIKKLSENAKKELLKAFKGTTRNAKIIKSVWDDIVVMWAQHQSTAAACTYAGISCNQLYDWVDKYNKWAKNEYPKHHPEENPVKATKHAIDTMKMERDFALAESKSAITPSHFIDATYKRKKNAIGRDREQEQAVVRPMGRPPLEDRSPECGDDDQAGTQDILTKEEEKKGYFIDEAGVKRTRSGYKKNSSYTRRGKYDIDLKELTASPADLKRIEENFRPASLKSGTIVKQAKAIREEEQKLDNAE